MICWNGFVVQLTCNPLTLTLVRLNIDCLYFYLYCPVMIILVYSWSFLSILDHFCLFLIILDHSCLFLSILYQFCLFYHSCILRCFLDYFWILLIILVYSWSVLSIPDNFSTKTAINSYFTGRINRNDQDQSGIFKE